LTLILILLPPKGGLGAQPQGFDFVFLPEGHHVQMSKNTQVLQKKILRGMEVKSPTFLFLSEGNGMAWWCPSLL
ncbi:MAG: hypothetical protein HW380_3252, partial [Magnetococcales bacterium]|nr:hypothetical protein [Magnetococcales bacterium]